MEFKEILTFITNINNWTISDILSVISIVIAIAIVGGIFAYKQWKYSNKIKRADFIDRLLNKLRFDKEMAQTMSEIDYDHGWYDKNFHNNQDDDFEKRIDSLLSYLSYICYLKKEKHIREKEFGILEYEVNRVCTSPSVVCYLWNLYHFSAAQNTKCSFYFLIDYGIENGLIDTQEFMNSKSTKYIKTLNF